MLQTRTIASLREHDEQIDELVLEHQSSYDEMIGKDLRHQPNRLQVPISLLSNELLSND